MADTALVPVLSIATADDVENVLREASLYTHDLERQLEAAHKLQEKSDQEIAALRADLEAATRKLAAIGNIVADKPLLLPEQSTSGQTNRLKDSFVL